MISEGQPIMRCPFEKCTEILTPKLAEKYLKDNKKLLEKYNKFFTQSVVDGS